MNASTLSTQRPLTLVAVIIVAIIVLALTGVGIYGLLRGPDQQSTSVADDDPASSERHVPGTVRDFSEPREVSETTDPEVFARSVAHALFTWDTTSGYEPSDYAQRVIDVGDPTGAETNALASDIRSYLPTADGWTQLRQHQTRQWITLETLEIPEAWQTAEDQAAADQLLPGTTAYTITGTRHRAGIWGENPEETSRPVAFTLFMTCEPTYEACRLLRLSQVDSPLE